MRPTSILEILGGAVAAFVLAATLARATITICTTRSWTAKPRPDRWHRSTPSLFGGVALWASFIAVSGVLVRDRVHWELIGLSSLIFLLGFADDILRLRPRTKIMVQTAAAVLMVSAGITCSISSNVLVSAGISVVWVIGMTNAFNLLDNMDGLASGIAVIATISLALICYLARESQSTLVLGIFAGALAGFLVFNFNPARIFLGDTGSLPIGFFLGSMMFAQGLRPSRASAWTLLVPALVFAVPLLDTILVSVTRRLRGQPISQGGTDHASHRFVKLGIRERNVVAMLYGVSGISGAIALVTRTMLSQNAVAVVVLWFFILAVFGFHLFQKEFTGSCNSGARRMSLTNWKPATLSRWRWPLSRWD